MVSSGLCRELLRPSHVGWCSFFQGWSGSSRHSGHVPKRAGTRGEMNTFLSECARSLYGSKLGVNRLPSDIKLRRIRNSYVNTPVPMRTFPSGIVRVQAWLHPSQRADQDSESQGLFHLFGGFRMYRFASPARFFHVKVQDSLGAHWKSDQEGGGGH